MINNPTLDSIAYKLKHTNQLFVEKSLLETILKLSNSVYQIYHLVQSGFIEVIKRDTVYLNKLYPKTPNPEAIVGLYQRNKTYMIGGIGLYNEYGFTTQQAQKTVVYTTKTSGEKTIAGQRFIFIAQAKSFFYGRERKQTQGVDYYRMDIERALIQLILDNNGVLEFYRDIQQLIQSKKIDIPLVIQYAEKHLTIIQRELLYRVLRIGTQKI